MPEGPPYPEVMGDSSVGRLATDPPGTQVLVRPHPATDDPTGDPTVDVLLAEVGLRLEPHLGRMVEELYERLSTVPELLEVVQRLTPDQFTHLKKRQAEHVRLLLSPGLRAADLQARSRQVGRVHAMIGVRMDWYVDAVTDHRNALLRTLQAHGDGLDLALAQSVVTDRFMWDLNGQLLGMRDLDDAQNALMLQVLEQVAAASTVADLVQGVVDALGDLDGMAVCMFARQDAHGVMATELGSGPGFAPMLVESARGTAAPVTTDAGSATGQGPIGQAWRTGTIQRCDALGHDERTVPWRDLAQRLGWGSSAAVPLLDARGRTRALLSLQSYWPGYFAAPGRVAMLEQLQRVIQQGLSSLEERPTLSSGVSGYADRTLHLDLLARGRVKMLFQPLVTLPDGRLSKLEALARLVGDDRLISPAEFLPAFGDDELFLLFDLGVRQSLQALCTWERQGLVTGVSVNLPVVAADDPRYVRLVRDLLTQYDVAPARLTLELLETGVVDRESTSPRLAVDELKDLGVRLAQDDLGSGYSSLLRLRHFAFDDVKIDRGLVRGSERAPGAALHFIRPISSIAHSLGLTVVIEGLEDDGLIEVAVQLGVDQGQGFGIARPMPAEEVLGWVRDYRLDIDPARPAPRPGRWPRTSPGSTAWPPWPAGWTATTCSGRTPAP